jgi:hypothetical protein
MIVGRIANEDDGLAWELSKITAMANPERIVLIMPPLKVDESCIRWDAYSRLSRGRIPSKVTDLRPIVVGFHHDWSCTIRTMGHGWFNQGDYEAALGDYLKWRRGQTPSVPFQRISSSLDGMQSRMTSAPLPSSPPPEWNPGNAKVISDEKKGVSSSQSAWLWPAVLVVLCGTLLNAFYKTQKKYEDVRDSLPKPPSEETLKNLFEEVRRAQELDPIVIHTRNVPKAGERDGIELYLRTKLARLRQGPNADPQQIQRIEKSLAYWQERKKEWHGQQIPLPHVPEGKKASEVE